MLPVASAMETRQSPDGMEDPRVVGSVVRSVLPSGVLIGSGRAMVTGLNPL